MTDDDDGLQMSVAERICGEGVLKVKKGDSDENEKQLPKRPICA